MIDLQSHRATSKKRHFIERIKALILLEALLAKQTMEELQSNLEDNTNTLKDDYSSRTELSIFTSIASVY